MSPGTLQALGPQRWEATSIRRGDRMGQYSTRDRHFTVEFGSGTSWRVEVRDDVEIIEQGLRVGALEFRRNSESGAWLQQDAGPANPVELHRTVIEWDGAIAPFAAQLAWRREGTEVIEGRDATIWSLTLAPPPAVDGGEGGPSKQAMQQGIVTVPVALEGRIWIDDITHNRLRGEFVGRFLPAATATSKDDADEVHVEYRERRIPLSAAPEIGPPLIGTIRTPGQGRAEMLGRRAPTGGP